MPLLTFQLALLLASCVAIGAILTWAVLERRLRAEKRELEQHMNHALQSRYQAYEGLEQGVIRVLARFEALEREFKQRLTEARDPSGAPEQTLTLRSSNPELWEIEREHHRQRSEQARELSSQSTRLASLMDEIQTLESTCKQREHDLEQLAVKHATAVSNFSEGEKAASAKIERLEAALDRLEPFEGLYEAARRELASAQEAGNRRAAEQEQRAQALQARIDALAQTEQRARQIEELAARREREAHEAKQRCAALESELAGARQRCTQLQSSGSAVERERDAALEAGRETGARLAVSEARLLEQQQRIDALKRELESQRTQSAAYRAKLNEHSNHVGQAWSVLSELKPMLESLEQKLKVPDEPSGALPSVMDQLSVLDDKQAQRGQEAQSE